MTNHITEAIDYLSPLLGNRVYLAALLGVSERTLSEWETVHPIPLKANRLFRLKEGVRYLRDVFGVTDDNLLSVLQNGRVDTGVYQSDDEGSVSLIGYLVSLPYAEFTTLDYVEAAYDDWKKWKEGKAMTDKELNDIEARANASTPGPWIDWGDIGLATDNTQANCEFIAAARTDVPALIAEVKRLRLENASLKSCPGCQEVCHCGLVRKEQ